MITLQDVVPCSVCGSYPILQRGNCSARHQGRLVCPNYKDKKIIHGNLSVKTNGIPKGFTNWCYYFWTEEQEKNEAIPILVKEWNSIHRKF